MRKLILLGAALSSAASLVAQVQQLQPLSIKPGLWRVTMTSAINGLPPNTNTYESCVKPADLTKYPFTDPKEKCTWTVQSSTGSLMSASGSCASEGLGKVDFSLQLAAVDTENAKGTGQMTLNGPRGAMNGVYSGTGKWIRAMCP